MESPLPDGYTPVHSASPGFSAPSPYTTARANACLIAAAPELLAALEALVDWGREHTSPSDANSPHALLADAAHAINKARLVPYPA